MEVFKDITEYTPALLIGGIILFGLGFLLRGKAKKSAVCAVFSVLFLVLGSACLAIVIIKFIGDTISGWQNYSEVMR